ncbi:MAG: terminase [Candidatus Amulumruptor caecigallinarius]|nr:terminase [Candidatus Amulumruptor caecigallinarius]
MMTDAILAENERRNSLRREVFNPVTGRGSTGKRFLFNVKGLENAWCAAGGNATDDCAGGVFLPEAMRTDADVAGLLEHGDTDKWLRARDKRRPDMRTREALRQKIVRLRMLHDFPYWAATRAYVKNKYGGDDVLFVLNRPQRSLVERLESMRLAAKPIRLILLKARQWGGSTCTQLYMAWLQLVHKRGLNSLIIAHQGAGSDEIKDMFDRMISRYPTELLHEPGDKFSPKEKRIEGVGNSRAAFRVPARNCKVKVGSAERPDSCRGGDYSLVHCSEVGIWKRTLGKTPEQIVRSACSGVLLRPMTMILYESTANGTGNFFHREYEAAKLGRSQFEAMFVAWHEIDQYTLELDEAAKRKLASSLREGRNSEAAPNDRSQPGKYLWWLWEQGATLEAIAWYISERSKYTDHGLMAAEYPSDDVEAFVHSGSRVFDKYRVERLRAECLTPPVRGEIDVEGAHDATSRIISDRERARLLKRAEFINMQSGSWQVWRLPDRREGVFANRYVVVVDVGGRSAKADWSVIVVFDRSPMCDGNGPEVVAQWRGHTDFDILAWRAALAASFYGEALLVIESNTLETRDPERDTDGDQSCFILNRLRDVYPNLYARPQSEEDVRRHAPTRYGFHTNMATKPMIIATLVKVIREGLYMERDPACLDEYLTYERRQNGSYGAISGYHDDLLMTRAIGLHICFHELEPPRNAATESITAPRRSGNYAIW